MTSCVLVLIIVNSAAVPGLFLSELWLAGSECGHEHSVSILQNIVPKTSGKKKIITLKIFSTLMYV